MYIHIYKQTDILLLYYKDFYFSPLPSDLGSELTCAAGNKEISSLPLVQDKIKLQVFCKYYFQYRFETD